MKKTAKDNEFSNLLKHVNKQVKRDPDFSRRFAMDALPNAAYRKAKAQEVEELYLTD